MLLTIYNLIRQTAADEVLPAAAEADIGVMNGWSILRGILTGVDIDAEIERGRWKKEGDVAAAYPIWEWCVEEEISLLQLALQFCLKEDRIQGNNIGSLNVEQLEANVRAASTPLSDEVWEKYEARFGEISHWQSAFSRQFPQFYMLPRSGRVFAGGLCLVSLLGCFCGFLRISSRFEPHRILGTNAVVTLLDIL